MSIAFGGSRTLGTVASPATNFAFNYDVGAGADRYLFVMTWMAGSSAGLAGTYDGNGMTELAFRANWFFGAGRISLWGLQAPTSGSNLIDFNWTTGQNVRFCAAHYTGVRQVIGPHTSTAAGGSSTGSTLGLTPSVSDAWMFLYAGTTNSRTISAGTGSTLRNTSNGQLGFMDSNGPITNGVQNDMTFSIDSSAAWGAVAVIMEAAGGAAASGGVYYRRRRSTTTAGRGL